jgi:hypothetical protein
MSVDTGYINLLDRSYINLVDTDYIKPILHAEQHVSS